jgi:hypothetical protein
VGATDSLILPLSQLAGRGSIGRDPYEELDLCWEFPECWSGTGIDHLEAQPQWRISVRGHQAAPAEDDQSGRKLSVVGRPEAVIGTGLEDRGHRVRLVAHSSDDQTDAGMQLAVTISGEVVLSTAMTSLAGGKATRW